MYVGYKRKDLKKNYMVEIEREMLNYDRVEDGNTGVKRNTGQEGIEINYI